MGSLLAKLMSRFGRRIGQLTWLSIEYPVGRSGARFEARLPGVALRECDLTQLRFFVVQDDHGHRYPAMIEHVSPVLEDHSELTIRGVVVAGW